MKKINIFNKIKSILTRGQSSSAPAFEQEFQHVAVHPCVINQQAYIVYPRGLQERSPVLFQQLVQHYSREGYRLKEDQRENSTEANRIHDRRRWAPVILFTASLLFENTANAEMEIHIEEQLSQQTHQVALQIVPTQEILQKITKEVTPLPSTMPGTIKSATAKTIFTLLKQHYRLQESDPKYIEEDLKQIANYYSEYPEVIGLLNTLKNKNWELTYNEHDWVTVASGNVFQVEKAVIHFNTRSAAQLRLNNSCKENPVCIASPADALLHELLHTHSMLVKTDEFLAQGGMSSMIYPYQHEYAVIKSERNLYSVMSKRDQVKRPHRHEHTGRIVKTHCPTCIK